MDGDTIARIAYLALLGLAVGGWLLVEGRNSIGKTLRQAMAWALIFVGVIAGYGLWQDIRGDVMPSQGVIAGTGQVVSERRFDGHFYLDLELNGTPVRFMVDTGATDVVLTPDDARAAGLDVDNLAFTDIATTANGQVRTAPARIDTVTLEGITDRNLRVYVNGGEMDTSLLGMAYLSRFDRIEISGDKLILTR